jgi:hypothetical protein
MNIAKGMQREKRILPGEGKGEIDGHCITG